MSEPYDWRIAGSYYEVCNCEAICPCRRQAGRQGGQPTYETCDFALSWFIERGKARGVSLDGQPVVMVGSFRADEPGSPWRVILYVDDRASTAQREVLAELFLGKAGGTSYKNFAAAITEVHAVRSARIELDHSPNQERIEAGGYLSVKTREPVAHEFAVTCGIPGHDQPGREIVAEIFHATDGPFDWEIRGRCGFATRFDYSAERPA